MQFATRAIGLTTIAMLTAAIVLFRPGADPVAVAAGQPAEVPADLAMVPADAIGFVHVRAAELWKNDVFTSFRQTFEKAGPKVLEALDNQFVPKISTFERATAFLLLDRENPRAGPMPYLVLRFSAPFDPDAVAAAYLKKPEKVQVAGKTVYGRRGDFGLYFPDKQHIVVSDGDGFEFYFRHDPPKTGPMSYGLKLAASGKPLVGSVNLAAIPFPPKALEDLPPEVKSLLKAEHVTMSLDLGVAARVDLTAGYKNAADAQEAEKAVKALAEYARKELAKVKEDLEKKFLAAKGPRPAEELPEALLTVFGLGAINSADELLANPGAYVKRDGANLTASVTLPKDLVVAVGGIAGVGAGLLLPAVQKVRAAAARMQSMNNLKQIAIAVHAYHDANGHFPQDIVDKNGKPLLSWRVAILPYIEQDNIYKQFKLDEAWDSPNNKRLSQVAIKTFISPQGGLANPAGMTHYQGFVGPGTVFEPGKKLTLNNMTDGTSNTILAVETADAVEWAKPGGIPFDPKKPFPKLTSISGNDLVSVAMCDGSVRSLNLKKISEMTLKAAVTHSGGEVLGKDWDD